VSETRETSNVDVTLVLTHDCNLACDYCYAGAKVQRRMSPEIAQKAVDLAFVDDPKRAQLSFFGGEPLLAYELLLRSAEQARSEARARGIELKMSVTTNGTLLDDARARELAALDVYVALSIDGTREAHDAGRPLRGGGSSFEQVTRGLDVLVRRAMPFETISVVTPQNAHLVGETVEYLFAAGVPRVGLNPCYEAAFTDDELAGWERGLERAADAMIAWYRKGRIVSVTIFDNKILAAIKGGLASGDKCSLGQTSVAVAPSGNLYSCERLVADDENLADVMGHVDSWKPIAEDACPRGPVNDECGPCGERWRCGSFCACSNRAETGRSDLAGGTQCWHERTTARIADRIAETLWEERNTPFIAWFYGRMAGLAPSAEPPPQPEPDEVAAPRGPANSIARTQRAPVTSRKRLVVMP
jgi:uncharacterized protein